MWRVGAPPFRGRRPGPYGALPIYDIESNGALPIYDNGPAPIEVAALRPYADFPMPPKEGSGFSAMAP